MTKIQKHPNFYMELTTDAQSAIYECPGRCKYATFFISPAEDDDDCSKMGDGRSCNSLQARAAGRAAAKRLMADQDKMETA
jgi:hypothetical protein